MAREQQFIANGRSSTLVACYGYEPRHSRSWAHPFLVSIRCNVVHGIFSPVNKIHAAEVQYDCISEPCFIRTFA